eukprot:3594901-Rhodomonas_salina.1
MARFLRTAQESKRAEGVRMCIRKWVCSLPQSNPDCFRVLQSSRNFFVTKSDERMKGRTGRRYS